MIETLKNALFNAFIFIGMFTICLALIWCMLKLLNWIFKFTKYIVMYQTYKRNIKMFDLENKVIVSKDGKVISTCITDLDEQVKILEKAIQNRNNMKKLQDKYSK